MYQHAAFHQRIYPLERFGTTWNLNLHLNFNWQSNPNGIFTSNQIKLTMSKPVFVLLNGAWHTPKCWSLLTSELTEAGFESLTPALPSSSSNPPTPDWSADVELIRKTVSELVDEGRDVVVVMHSFSGMTGGTALHGLGKAERVKEKKAGGVIRLVYVVAFLVPEGFQHSPKGTRDNMVPEMKTDFEVRCVENVTQYATS